MRFLIFQNRLLPCILFFGCLTLAGCKKFLEAKPIQSLQIPSTLEDLQAILDNAYLVPSQDGTSYDEASADNYYCTDASLDNLNPELRNVYIWKNFVYSTGYNDWAHVYELVNITNIILNKLPDVDTSNAVLKNNIRGSACFFRAWAYFQGIVIFVPAYDSSTAATTPGLSLPVSADDPAVNTRSSVQETYDRILGDLSLAVTLLPDNPQTIFRPSRASALALLARVYLSIRNYPAALDAATSSLEIKDQLMDFNELDSGSSSPVPQFNTEVLFHSTINQPTYYSYANYYANVDSGVVSSFAADDLRGAIFLDRSDPADIRFKGSYSPGELFNGFCTDEMWLTKAECEARAGQTQDALNTLNAFLQTRWMTGTFEPFTAASSEEALSLILSERRKELLFRNIRWMDIKRLNKEGAGISITRIVAGQSYVLPPNDPRFALPIPQDIINTTGMVQNSY